MGKRRCGCETLCRKTAFMDESAEACDKGFGRCDQAFAMRAQTKGRTRFILAYFRAAAYVGMAQCLLSMMRSTVCVKYASGYRRHLPKICYAALSRVALCCIAWGYRYVILSSGLGRAWRTSPRGPSRPPSCASASREACATGCRSPPGAWTWPQSTDATSRVRREGCPSNAPRAFAHAIG